MIAFTLLLVGCGNAAGESSGPTDAPASSAQVGGCASGDAALASAEKLGVADLGLGEAPVALTGPGAPCPHTVFTRAPDGTAYVELGYEPVAARVISVGDTQVVAVRQDHPRGGFQEHLYVARGAALNEVTIDGNPLLPFVALDTPGQPHAYADCDGGGLTVLDPAPIQPPGAGVGWDVFATTYTLAEGEADSTPRSRLEHSVPDSRVEARRPTLFSDTWFTHCR